MSNFVDHYMEDETKLKTPMAKKFLENIKFPKINSKCSSEWVSMIKMDYFMFPRYMDIGKTVKNLNFDEIFK